MVAGCWENFSLARGKKRGESETKNQSSDYLTLFDLFEVPSNLALCISKKNVTTRHNNKNLAKKVIFRICT